MLSTLFTIAAVHLIALMSPGPDCFIVMQTAVGRSRKEALCCVLGITLGVAFWAALSLLGLQWLFEQFAWLRAVDYVLGRPLLGVAGLSSLRSACNKPTASRQNVPTPRSGFRSFAIGLLTNLSNAKALIYFSSVFSLFITADMGTSEAVLIYAVVVLESFFWFSFVALILGLPKPKAFTESPAGGLTASAGQYLEFWNCINLDGSERIRLVISCTSKSKKFRKATLKIARLGSKRQNTGSSRLSN